MKIRFIYLVLSMLFLNTLLISQSLELVTDMEPGMEDSFDEDAMIFASFEDGSILLNNGYYGSNNLYYSDGTGEGTIELTEKGNIVYTIPFDEEHVFLISFQKNSEFYLMEFDKSTLSIKFLASDWNLISDPIIFQNKLYFCGKENFSDDPSLFYYDPSTSEFHSLFDFTGFTPLSDICIFDDHIFLIANLNNENHLIKFDGLSNDPELIKYLNASDNYINKINMTVAGELLYFWFDDDNGKYSFYRTDGTEAGTFIIFDEFKEINTYFHTLNKLVIPYKDKVYFRAVLNSDSKSNANLYVSDGTINGTKLIPKEGLEESYSRPEYLTVFNDKMYLYGIYSYATFPPSRGLLELDESKNKLIKTEFTNIPSNIIDYGDLLHEFQDSLYFLYGDFQESARKIASSDCSDANIHLLENKFEGEELTSIAEITGSGNKLFFFANHPLYGRELFYYNFDDGVGNAMPPVQETVVISPNPATDQIFIDVSQPIEKVTILNISGNKLIEIIQPNTKTISTSSLSKGIYFYQVFTAGKAVSGRVLIQ